MVSSSLCSVCSKEESKYKCPVCLIKYCSVPCFTSHRGSDLCLPIVGQPLVTMEVDKHGNIITQNVLFPTDDTVPMHKLQRLGESDCLKKMFQDPSLRDMIKEADTCHNAEVVMSRLMQNSTFGAFADVCLNIVEPPPQDNEDESD